MITSFIYGEILDQLGWFDCGKPYSRLDEEANYVHFINQPITINEDTTIAYFPGCFAHFHDGHLSVVDDIKQSLEKINDNYLIVIAPANTDYTVSKYGADSVYATNKYRYDRICEVLKDYKGNVAVDLNPMLNNDRDYNFTDLLKDFVDRHIAFEQLTHAPYIVCGKDRDYFTNLTKLTSKIRVWYGQDNTGLSSSDYIKNNPKPLPKKVCYLRCQNEHQYISFREFWSDQYVDIRPIYLSKELLRAEKMVPQADVTICKDYAHLLPYVPFHRKFINPLDSNNGHEGDVEKLRGKQVLDSDIYTGSTARAIEQLQGTLLAVIDLSNDNDIVECVDFADFLEDNYCYPHYDISLRCSMKPFTKAYHDRLEMFKIYIKYNLPEEVSQ